MRPQHNWESESDILSSSDEDDQFQKEDSNDDDLSDSGEISEILYENSGSIIRADHSSAAADKAGGQEVRPLFSIFRGLHQLTNLAIQFSRLLLVWFLRLRPLCSAVTILGLLYSYLFCPMQLKDISSHWAALIGLTAVTFKIGLCLGILILSFASLANAFARQFSVARALSEAEFDTVLWRTRMQPFAVDSISRNLLPKKMTYFISAKWSMAAMRTKKLIIALLTLGLLTHHCFVLLEHKDLQLDFMFCIFSLMLLVLLVCLFSTDILAVQWGSVSASCLLYYLVLLGFFKVQSLAQKFEGIPPSLLLLRDAMDYVPRLDLDRMGWSQSGNMGCGPDFMSLTITILIDGVCIGAMHESNFVASLVRLFHVFGANFIGLTGVEALALLAAQFFSMPCVLLLLFPYLRCLSESEAVFVFTVLFNSVPASTDRRFIYFGTNRETFLMQAVALRQLCIFSSVPICKVLFPMRAKNFVGSAGFQNPGKSTGSLLKRMYSGAFAGLRLATLVSKVMLIAKLSAIILCLTLDTIISYISSLVYNNASVRHLLAILLKPFLFLLSDSKASLDLSSLMLAEMLTFKTMDLRMNIMETMLSTQTFQLYGNMTGLQFQSQRRADLLTARYIYEPVSKSMMITFSELTTPLLAIYMTKETGSLIQHALFIWIFFFHCMTGSRVTRTMAGKVVAASLIGLLISTRFLGLLMKTI